MNLKPGLYIVSTPIGNLGDITLRAIDTLSNSDLIFCEDTRMSSKLLVKHNIQTPLKVYNDNSDETQRVYIKELIEQGKIISLISDAGTPLISDPGYKLVRDLKKQGIYVEALPGACAAITALSVSALPTNQFMFSGFLPKTYESKIKVFEKLLEIEATLIFYETSNRLIPSLKAALEIFGDREACVARELTKLYQESRYCLLSELISHYSDNPPRGEIVLCISGNLTQQISTDVLQKELSDILNKGETAKSASDLIFTKYKNQYSRKEIYKLANDLKKRNFGIAK